MKKIIKISLKRCLKRKYKITEALIVAFLITGHVGFANDVPTSGHIDTPGDYIISDDQTFSDGISIDSNDVTLTNNNVVNNLTRITDPDDVPTSTQVNGVIVGHRFTGVTVNNTGVITSEVNYIQEDLNSLFHLMDLGNGVLGGIDTTINNTGVITGEFNQIQDSSSNLEIYVSGNGVFGTFNNTGVITGEVNTTTELTVSAIYSSGNGAMINMEVESINNTGVITGELNSVMDSSSNTNFHTSGNGVIGFLLNNTGVITGELNSVMDSSSNTNAFSSGNGVALFDHFTSGSYANNTGVIRGELNLPSFLSSGLISNIDFSGNGVFGTVKSNTGVITGKLSGITGYANAYFSGNGMAYQKSLTTNVTNSGLIAGSESAIALNDSITHAGSISNYGVLAGRQIISGSSVANDNLTVTNKDLIKLDLGSKYNNYGIEIKLKNYDDRTIASIQNKDNALGTYDETNDTRNIDGADYTVLNTEIKNSGTDSYKEVNDDTTYDHYIINGAGVGSGTLTINSSDMTLTNSVVNGYEKAITLNGDSILNATNTTFNGGGIGKWNEDDLGYFNVSNVIEGDSRNNNLILAGHSVVNGNVDLGAGDDILAVSTDSQLNGDIDGGDGENDSLALGDKPFEQSRNASTSTANNLNIYNKINGFENINVKGSVTLYETSKISGAKDITISEDSTLNLRIDPTITTDGKITGHALYNSGATVSGHFLTNDGSHTGVENDTSAGTLNLITNGIGRGRIIGMGDTKLDDKLYVRTDSILNKADKLSDGDIEIKTGEDLVSIFVTPLDPSNPITPDKPDWITHNQYKKLDLIYKSIYASGDDNLNALYPTVNTDNKTGDEAGENFLLLLNDVFMANPYGYVAQTSKDSMNLFNNIILNNPFKANEGHWMVYGGLTFGGDDYDSSYKNYTKGNYYGFDTYGAEINTDSNTTGGYALAEYGLNKNTTIGFIVGGANNTTNISNGSKIEGDSVYLGTYLKSEIDNFNLTIGAGYQFSNFDTTRVARSKYQYNKYDEELATNGFNIYTGISYNYELNNKWYLEPKLNLMYNRVTQDSVEEDGVLSIKVDKESFNYLDTELGMDLVRKIPLNKGEGKLRFGLSYIYALDGSDADYVTGNYIGGSDFDILVPERDKGIAKIKASYDVEYKSGVIYSIGGAYLPSDDRNEYYASVGVGFKFNDLEDFIPTKTTSTTSSIKEKIKASKVPIKPIKEIAKTNVVITNNIGGFNLNSSKLTKNMKKELDKTALDIQKKKDIKEIKVIGHTDNKGPEKFNEKLSLKRAESAKSRLSKTLPGTKILTTGKGSAQSLKDNSTIEGRKVNRRIEIKY